MKMLKRKIEPPTLSILSNPLPEKTPNVPFSLGLGPVLISSFLSFFLSVDHFTSYCGVSGGKQEVEPLE